MLDVESEIKFISKTMSARLVHGKLLVCLGEQIYFVEVTFVIYTFHERW